MDSHGYANKNLDVLSEKFIPQNLSVHNACLASLTFMKRTEIWYDGDLRTGLIDMLRRFKDDPVSNTKIPEYFNRYVERMLSLYEEVKVIKTMLQDLFDFQIGKKSFEFFTNDDKEHLHL